MGRRYLLAGILLLMAGLAMAQSDQRTVMLKETTARSAPSYLSKAMAVLSYGDRVVVRAEQGSWVKVALPGGGEGWVSSSALQKTEVAMRAGSGNVQQQASAADVSLAGKGFNQGLEKEYRQEKSLDYTWVDRMEKFQVSPEQAAAFLKAGGLSLEGGQP